MSQIAVPYDTASKTERGPSNDAGARLRPKSPTLRDHVLTVLSRGHFTADEIAERMGRSILAVRPRVTELAAAGKIIDSGSRRKNSSGASATVWKLKQEA